MTKWTEHFGNGMRGRKFASKEERTEHVRGLARQWHEMKASGMESDNEGEGILDKAYQKIVAPSIRKTLKNRAHERIDTIANKVKGKTNVGVDYVSGKVKGLADKGIDYVGNDTKAFGVKKGGLIGSTISYKQEGGMWYVYRTAVTPTAVPQKIAGPYPTKALAVASQKSRVQGRMYGGSTEILLSPGLGSTAPKIVRGSKK
jgi:hypothetical protein